MRRKKEKIDNQSNVSGITLIALIITIIVLLILAAVSINAIFGENGLLSQSQEAKFKTKMASIAEQWNLYVADNMAEYPQTVKKSELYAGGDILYDIIADEEIEMDTGLIRNIRELLSEMGEQEEKYCMAYEGDFYYVSRNTTPNNEKQVKWCKEIGIKIWEYKERANTKIVNGEYKLVNRSIFMYTKSRYRICKRKDKIYKRKRRKISTRKLDNKGSR